MKTSFIPTSRYVVFRRLTQFIAFALAAGCLTARAETLISCTGDPGGDYYYRGFYVPAYPGTSLETVRLVFSTYDAGTYNVSLTARANSYDGAVLASSTTNVSLAGAYPQDVPVTFAFPAPTISKGSTVCFILSQLSGPGDLYYSVPASNGCTEVVQTSGTTPPLDSKRRDGVNVVITGDDSGWVQPGYSIQAAIDASDPGETVFVQPGTYTENLTLRSGVSVMGSGYSDTILRGTGTGDVITANNVTNSAFEGFKIIHTGAGMNDSAIQISGGDLLLNNNWIVGHMDGVQIYSGSSAIVRNNIVEGNGDPSDSFLDYGIIILHATPLIANNLILSNNGAGIYVGWADSTGAQVINNTVVGNSNNGIWCYSTNTVVIKNNIFARNNTGISASHGATPEISFNDVFGNTWLDYDSQSGGVADPGFGDISEDPMFDSATDPPFTLAEGSPCIDAGDPAPIYNDSDGSRNDMGAFGGPTGFLPGLMSPVISGFLFNNIGTIPTSEITQSGSQAGLANVSSSVASALHIYPYADAPFGGNLWLHGLFGLSDAGITHYRILAAPWSGGSPPALADFEPLTDPLSKIKYTVRLDGTVTASLESVGPNADGLYLRTDLPTSGYWAHPDLKLIWNTRAVPNGRYDLLCKGYYYFFGIPWEASLPENDLTRITVWVDNNRVHTEIISVRDQHGNPIPECGVIPLNSPTENLQFEFTASHDGGFLRNFKLDALYGKNRYGGVIASDQYVGSNDGSPPTWSGVTAVISNTAPAHAANTLSNWTTCAYQFRLRAWARTTDGFKHIYSSTFNDHYFLNLGAIVPTSCVADLDGDGDVDNADLAIFAAQYGRTNCITSP